MLEDHAHADGPWLLEEGGCRGSHSIRDEHQLAGDVAGPLADE
jgi:hypothetical protein